VLPKPDNLISYGQHGHGRAPASKKKCGLPVDW
jgi:hypothetical protein